MTKPSLLLGLKGKKFSCLGSQLIEIIDFLHKFLAGCTWYACDVEINEKKPITLNLQSEFPKKIGTYKSLTKILKNVEQLNSGVFLAYKEDKGDTLPSIFLNEEETFKNLDDALVTIRAFDTSYYELYTNNATIINELNSFVYHHP